MSIELRQLRYFRHVARELNFSRAATCASVSQSSISEQIGRLEDVLGVRLFDRSQRQIRLTLAGELLRDEVDALVGQVDTLVSRVRAAGGEVRGVLKVGYSEMAIGTQMPRILHLFRELHPGIEVLLNEQSSIGVERALLDGRFDCVFAPGSGLQPGLTSLFLGAEPVLLCIAADSPLATALHLSLEALRDEPLILPDEGSKLARYIQMVFATAQLTPRVAARAGRALSIMTLVASEQGVAFIPASLTGLKPAGVIFRPVEGSNLSLPFSLTWATARESTPLRQLITVAESLAQKTR